jgi:organic hydroperoxide reductase OsmC/OhrA
MIESHDYAVTLSGIDEKNGVLASEDAGLPSLAVASPPEFGGPEAVWSPEHLFVASLSSCLMTTFRSLARRADLEVLGYSDQATGELKRGETGLFRIETVTMRPRVAVGDESLVAKAERLIEKAEEVCLIGRSVACRTVVQPRIEVMVGASR